MASVRAHATESALAARYAQRRSWLGRRARVTVVLSLLVLGSAVIAWSHRQDALAAIGRALVVEDPLEPVAAIVVSNASPAADALEAGRLFRSGISRGVVLTTWVGQPLAEELRQLGIPYPAPTELARTILARSGVPSEAIEVLPEPIDGTAPEIAVVAAFARQRRLDSVLYITERSHTGRAHWELQRALPQTRVLVRSPRSDTFDPESWWHSREHTRALVEQYLHWANMLLLGDWWSRADPSRE